MKKQTWKRFCIVSAILFIASILLTSFWWRFDLGMAAFVTSIASFAIPTLICLNGKSRIKYGIMYAVAAILFAISYIGMEGASSLWFAYEEIIFISWLLCIISLIGISVYLFADINKGEKL